MSCGCTSTMTASSSTTCGSCGYQCTSCICPPDPLVMPTVTCADPNVCEEIYPLECIKYTGDDIKCSTSASTLYPNVVHTVATNGDTLNVILSNINNQLCYLFSADFINQMLTNIKNTTELSTLFCSISTTCGSTPTALICPTVSSLTYNVSDIQNYLQAQFSYVPFATSYVYKFYVEDSAGSNTYTAVGGGTLPQPSAALPITISAPLTGTLYTPSRKYIVLVQAVGAGYASSGPDLISIYTGSTLTSTQYNAINNNFGIAFCGFKTYQQSAPSGLTCTLKTLSSYFKPIPTDVNTLNFTFTQESLTTGSYPIVSYTVHWYLQVAVPTPTSYIYQYVYQKDVTISPYSPGVISTTAITKNYTGLNWTRSGTVVTITSTNHGLVTGGTIITSAYGGGAIPANTYTITYINANSFSIVGVNIGSTSGTLNYTTGIKPTDKVVVMITTNTANPEICSNGPIKRVNGTFSESEITGLLSNPQNNVFKNF